MPCQNSFTLGIHEISAGNQMAVSIYPNPAHNYVTISADGIIQKIELTDIEGRVLLTRDVGTGKFIVPVSNLAKGVYLINVQSESGGAVVKKVVVQ